MKPLFFIFCYLSATISMKAQDIYISKTASISFFSSTVMEDIEARSSTASSAIDLKSRNIIFKVANSSFQFKKKLMQEHFNENYIESDKYQFSTFKGKITDEADLSKDGTYNVIVEGSLDLHGIVRPYQSKATFIVNKGMISAKAVYKIKIEDHQIKVPTIVFKNIAEFVEVRISAVYQPKT